MDDTFYFSRQFDNTKVHFIVHDAYDLDLTIFTSLKTIQLATT